MALQDNDIIEAPDTLLHVSLPQTHTILPGRNGRQND